MIEPNEQQEQIPYHKPFPLSDHDKKIIKNRIEGVLNSGQLTNGDYVRELERKIKEYYKVEYVIATSSCTQALLLCLSFVNKEVQTSAFNWWSDLHVLNFLKKRIYFNDIDKTMWLPIESHPIQSLYLHTFGNLGRSFDFNAIYDGSHCLGAQFDEIGLATCISLAPTKLVTSGEGGLILTNDNRFAKNVIELRDKCSRMTEFNAIVGLQTFQYLDQILAWKKKVFNYYSSHIPGQYQEKMYSMNYNTIGFLNYSKLKIPKHIDYRKYYEPLHYDNGQLHNTWEVFENIICLPSYYNCPYEQITNDILELNGL